MNSLSIREGLIQLGTGVMTVLMRGEGKNIMKTLKRLAILTTFAAGLGVPAYAQKVVLTLTPPAAQAGVTISAYNFYRSDTPGGQVMGQHTIPGQTVPTYTDPTVVVGKTYYYKATVWCAPCNSGAGAESVFSNEAKIFIPVPVIVVPPPVLQQPTVTFP